MVEARLVVTALAMMLAMFLAGVHGLRHRIGIVILGLLSVVWFTVDRLFEGEVVVAVSRNHGIVVSDLVGVLGLLVTALLWFRTTRKAGPPL
jgi:hypothetical protein